ncbi:endonuclease domain-containing 1 protein-like [Erythrolamprus reginae]|uniref:endonuclease domain-containing 1 protein-like n=1 Tax=Erythrolamprus reginae TaxID=121349 RepID=UPI00396C9D50
MWLLWILPLAASFLLPATGEVVDSFRKCRQFFLDGKAPELKPVDPVRICQLYENKYRFATMYDKTRRIPLYSAYIYQQGEGDRFDEWMIEPQLALPVAKNRKSMELEETCAINKKVLEKNQAVDQDYRESIRHDRGHLVPNGHQPDQESKNATFTITNIVPQYPPLNAGQWRTYEETINAVGCQRTYIIAGAVPGDKLINGRVNIPSHIWAAGCCVIDKKRRRSWAVIAKNDRDEINRLTLEQLQDELATLYNKNQNNSKNNNNDKSQNKKNKDKKTKSIDLFNNACNVPQN